MDHIKITGYVLLYAIIIAAPLSGQSMSEFLGHWTGAEELSSPSMTYENRNISILIEEGGVREGFYIFTSSSEFLYNEDVDWAFHYFGFDKNETQLIFLRRFITPIGIVGYEELVYDLIDCSSDYFIAEYSSAENETYHQIRMDLNLMDIIKPLPAKVGLTKNYPNPFNPSTTINVFMEKISSGKLLIYNMNGKEVYSLHSGQFSSGITSYLWDGRDHIGNSVSSGTYLYQLIIDGNVVASQKMLLVK